MFNIFCAGLVIITMVLLFIIDPMMDKIEQDKICNTLLLQG